MLVRIQESLNDKLPIVVETGEIVAILPSNDAASVDEHVLPSLRLFLRGGGYFQVTFRNETIRNDTYDKLCDYIFVSKDLPPLGDTPYEG